MISREALLAHVRPFVEDLAVELATILFGRLEAQLDQALDAARSALASDIETPVIQTGRSAGLAPVPEAHRDRSNMLRRTEDANAGAGLPRTRRPATCRNCGASGFTSKGCGTTHQPLTKPAASVSPPVARAPRAPAPAPSPIPPPVLVVEVEELAAQDDDDDDELEVVVAPVPGPRDRFAAIEARAAARKVTNAPRSTSRT